MWLTHPRTVHDRRLTSANVSELGSEFQTAWSCEVINLLCIHGRQFCLFLIRKNNIPISRPSKFTRWFSPSPVFHGAKTVLRVNWPSPQMTLIQNTVQRKNQSLRLYFPPWNSHVGYNRWLSSFLQLFNERHVRKIQHNSLPLSGRLVWRHAAVLFCWLSHKVS